MLLYLKAYFSSMLTLLHENILINWIILALQRDLLGIHKEPFQRYTTFIDGRDVKNHCQLFKHFFGGCSFLQISGELFYFTSMDAEPSG